MKRYSPKDIETKWQKKWDSDGTYVADLKSDKPTYYGFAMFNYPSGNSIHLGHAKNFTIPDVLLRYKRQNGFETFAPVGFDSFGLPAENFAIKTGTPPRETTDKAIESYRKQYRALGLGVDWSREIDSSLPEYYRWTQWCFTQLHKAGLAYQKDSAQWWCTKCKTVLADEQVFSGKCWRHDGPDDPLVTKKTLHQWFFKITDYADDILEATDDLNWTPWVKTAQKNWIGRSEGATVTYQLKGLGADEATIDVFTTAYDTIYGTTFMVLAPEHPVVKTYAQFADNSDEIEAYTQDALRKSDIDREANKTKTGVPIDGLSVVNPANGNEIPVWVADYVLMGYGTGAVMAVPGEDERDFEFANKYQLPIVYTTKQQEFVSYQDIKKEPKSYIVANSAEFNGMNFAEAKPKILKKLFEDGAAQTTVNYKVRDWLISRQRYWGAPIPIIHCVSCFTPDDAVAATIDCADHQGFVDIKSGKKRILTRKREENIDRLNSGSIVALRDLETKEVIHVAVRSVEFFEGVDDLYQNSNYANQTFCREFKDVDELRSVYDGNRPGYSAQLDTHGIVVVSYDTLSKPVAVPDDQLPVELPEIDDYRPDGEGRSPLAKVDDWVNAPCPECGGAGRRETDTMDGYVCSSWYPMRYLSAGDNTQAWDPGLAKKWMPVDFYNGGDHATAHLLYARFFTRFFYEQGLIGDPEPFKQMYFHAKILAPDGTFFSKSKGNGIDPLEVIDSGYGADALRTYIMFIAPPDVESPWNNDGLPSIYRFLNRIFVLVQEFKTASSEQGAVSKETGRDAEILKSAHKAIKKVTNDIEAIKFNTAISAMMTCVNELYKIKEQDRFASAAWQEALDVLVQLVAPFAPHMAEELWRDLGHEDSIHVDHWPELDEQYLVEDTMKLAVQINGKVRAEIEMSADADEESIKNEALAQENVQKHLAGNAPKKVIYVTGRLVSVVV